MIAIEVIKVNCHAMILSYQLIMSDGSVALEFEIYLPGGLLILVLGQTWYADRDDTSTFRLYHLIGLNSGLFNIHCI